MAAPALNSAARAAMERMNAEAGDLNIWLRTQANAPAQRPWFRDEGLEPGGSLAPGRVGANQMKAAPYHWRWREVGPYLDRIAEIANVPALEAEIAHLQSIGAGAFFDVDSTQDFKDSTQVTGEVDQGGLGMPDRDYYTRDDPKSKEQRAEYQKHVAKMFELMGDPAATAAGEAQTVMDLETQLAKASQTEVERRDPKNVYHRMTQAEVRTLAPNFPWESYFAAVGLAGKGDVNVTAPEFFKEMGQMIS